MESTFPANCGNSPRAALVSDFVQQWAHGNSDALATQLADHFSWLLLGEVTERLGRHEGIHPPPVDPEQLEVFTVITHGKFAACDGFVAKGDVRFDFCHVFTFSSAGKAAKIAQIRTYLARALPVA